MVIQRKKLYDIISNLCNGEYVIGLHGINKMNAADTIKNTKDKIIKTGLKVQNGNSINGTVMFFGRIDSDGDAETLKKGLENYSHGNEELIIVAVPIIFRNSKSDELYLGSTNLESKYKSYMNTSGHEVTTLLDYVVLERDEELNKVVPKEFILGACKLLENDKVDFEINENHISFSNGVIDDEKFAKINKSVNQFLKIYGLSSDILHKDLSADEIQILKRKKEELEFKLQMEYMDNAYLGYDLVSILETLTQLLNEPKTEDKKL